MRDTQKLTFSLQRYILKPESARLVEMGKHKKSHKSKDKSKDKIKDKSRKRNRRSSSSDSDGKGDML